MRKFLRINAFLTILAVIFNISVVISVAANKPQIINWELALPMVIISGLIMILGASGVFTVATNPQVWLKLKEIEQAEEELRKERKEVKVLKEKLIKKIL